MLFSIDKLSIFRIMDTKLLLSAVTTKGKVLKKVIHSLKNIEYTGSLKIFQ